MMLKAPFPEGIGIGDMGATPNLERKELNMSSTMAAEYLTESG